MISVVVPVYNEKDNVEPLLKEISAVAERIPVSEIIYVDDHSTDGTFDVLKRRKDKVSSLRILRHQSNAGQSAALWTGVKAAGNDLIVTMDGDGQNDPADIEKLYNEYKKHAGTSHKVMVLGERTKRRDNILRRLSSRIANGVRGSLLKDRTRDTGCSLKMFSRRDYLALPYFDHMHRFLPALMIRDGVELIHIGVSHRPRIHGVSKYGLLDRLFVGISDLRGVMWLQKRARRASGVYEELS